MRFPDWMKPKRQRRVGNTVEVTLELDTTDLARRFAELGRAMRVASAFAPFASLTRAAAQAEQAMAAFQQTMTQDMTEAVRGMVRAEEVRQAGLEARYYVRGAMDPTYATPDARDAYVKALLDFQHDGPRLAAAFLRGWVEHHDADDWPELSGVCMCGSTIGPRSWCGEPYHVPMDQSAYYWSVRQ